MKKILLMYAKYAKRANESVLALLDDLSGEDRDKDRKSYYKSLSGLASHVVGSALYFFGLFRASSPAVVKALKGAEGLDIPEQDSLSAAEWFELKRACAIIDQATIDLVEKLSEEELAHPTPIDWYDGKPETVPLCFLLHQAFVHETHHRGQISQLLDEMGIEHDFSGIDIEFLPS
jgi:uncharacterized damage-inducible protein DinB